MAIRLVVEIREPAMQDADLMAALAHQRSFVLMKNDGTRFAVEPVAMGSSEELNNSPDVERAIKDRKGISERNKT
jgi:hypothetical protein